MSTQVLQKEQTQEAKAYLGTMKSLLKSYMDQQDSGNHKEKDEVLQEIYRFPLETKCTIHYETETGSYMILLGTGGPAVRVIGALLPSGKWINVLQHQDWFTPWRDVGLTDKEQVILDNFIEIFIGQ